MKNLMTKYVARLGLALILLVALLGSLSLPVQAHDNKDSVDLVLGGEGASPWQILYIVPGDSGTKTVTLHNAGNVDGVVIIWISDLTSSEGDNPEPETDIEGEGELDDYLLFNFSCDRLSTNITLPETIRELPQDPSDGRYLMVKPLKKGETVTVEWLWELPKETGNDVMGDCISFTTNYMLQKLEEPSPPTYYSLTVTCDPTEGGSVTLDPEQPTYEAGTSVELTATAAEGYAFGSWSDDLSGSTNPDTITMNSDKEVTAHFVSFTAPADVAVSAADPGVDSITVSTKDLGEVDTTNMPEILEAQEAYVVDSTGTGSFTLRFTDIANASNIVIYKVVDSTWTEIPITAITVIDATTVEVTMEVGDPILVFGLPTGITPPPPWDPWSYDEDGSGYIEIGELLQAINDYIAGEITISQLLKVINVYMWDPWSYDEDDSGYIEIGELCDAINGYMGNEISINQLMEVINLYITHTHE